MQIKVNIKGLDSLRSTIKNVEKQVRFAASKAINETAKRVAEAMPEELERAIDRPTPFTKRGVRVLKYANKGDITAKVGFMGIQAKYMQLQIEGGTRPADLRGVRLPSAIKVNEFGNIPKGVITQLIAVANKERKLGKVKARRIAVSSKVELFYGDPVDHNGKRFPRGIYKRIKDGGRGRLIPIVVFPVTSLRYKKKFDFYAVAAKIINKNIQPEFDKALENALRTAR